MGLVIDRMNWLSSNIVAVALMLLIAVSSYGATKKVYRYTNSAGTKVINEVIPPEYADKGFKVKLSLLYRRRKLIVSSIRRG
jgi:hypothetical protein